MILLDEVIDPAKIGIDTMWTLVAAALVFFMQAGFALVEAGFTRGKNTVNIVMKNLMDFVLGSLVYWAFGYALMFGTDVGSFIGTSGFFVSDNSVTNLPNMAFFIFQLVFAATAATIVSGAMAERTKFTAYLIYSVVISAVIYPISGHWAWMADGFLYKMGFHDFAGSSVVHFVGGTSALVGAMLLGPRIGKYQNGEVKVIPGHNLLIGALGVFILWLGWFGFNPGSKIAAHGADNAAAISLIFVTTNMAGAAAAATAMFVAWFRVGKPDIGITLNGALAGLVGVTAGCDIVSPAGAIAIGVLSGFVLPFALDFIENKLKIDDPVGAIAVHMVSGALGTILVGLFATTGGLFYGGGASLLVTQLIGVASIGGWTFVTAFILFFILKKTIGLRVSAVEEVDGLDIHEHGSAAYND